MATKTKEQIVLRALRRAGLASSAALLSPEPESIADGLDDLESMIAGWEGQGIKISYRYSGNPQPQPSEESNLPDWAVEPVIHNLAMRMLVDNSRPVDDTLSTLAYNGLQLLRAKMIQIPSLQRRSDMPVGAGNGGNSSTWGPRFYNETDSLQDADFKDLDF